MTTLKIAPKFALPLEVAGEAIAILAKRGAGKTNTATVLVEELYAAHVQTVVLDPVGAWWGLRSSADGQGEGLKVARIGGAYGDVPLEPTAGALIADVAVDTGQSLVIDLSDFPAKKDVQGFALAFAQRLYSRKAREKSLLHLVLEEADIFAPEGGGSGNAPGSQAAVEQLVRRGRSRGLGITLITQRSAVLSKDVLTQTDVLIVMRTTGPHDIKAIGGWVNARGDDHGAEVLASLPSLATGEAWIWNPERDLLKRAQIRPRRTFDSSQTPKPGQPRSEPRRVAEIDPKVLGEQIQRTVEQAKANDPRELHQKIRRLERELADRPTETEKVVERVPIEVPVLSDDDIARVEQQITDARDIATEIDRLPSSLRHAAEQLAEAIGRARTPPALEQGETKRHALGSLQRPRPAAPPARRPAPAPDADVQLKAGARRILETLARHHPMRVTRAQLGTLARFKITGGTFQTYFSQLKRLGLIDESGGDIQITDAGLDYIGHVPAAPQTTEELLEMWRGALKAGARAMLDVLVDRYGDELTKDELADAVGMTVSGGTFQTYLSTLRRNGLVDVEGANVRASDTLFLGAAR